MVVHMQLWQINPPHGEGGAGKLAHLHSVIGWREGKHLAQEFEL